MLALGQAAAVLLQRNVPPPPAPNPGVGLGGNEFLVLAIYGGLILVALVVHIFFLLTLANCFREISPRNRQMEPGMVWLNLIPIFGLIWIILTIIRLADSLKDEYDDRGLTGDGDFGKTLGIVYVVSSFVCGCVAIVIYIMYWVKIAGYTRELRESRGRAGRDLDEDRGFRDE